MTRASFIFLAALTCAASNVAVAQDAAVTPPTAMPPARDAPVVVQPPVAPVNDAPVVIQTPTPRPQTDVRVSDFKEPTPTTTYLPVNPVYRISTLDERLRQYLPNLHRPTLALLSSGQPMPQAWRNVADAGVRTVINLRPKGELGLRDEAGEVRAVGLNYIEIPVTGPADLTPANASRLWEALRNAKGAVLVHCASANRAGALLAVAAHREGKLSPSDALEFGKKAGLTSLAPVVDAVLNNRPLPVASPAPAK